MELKLFPALVYEKKILTSMKKIKMLTKRVIIASSCHPHFVADAMLSFLTALLFAPSPLASREDRRPVRYKRPAPAALPETD